MPEKLGVDTNVLVSALFFGGSLEWLALKAVRGDAEFYFSEYVRDEVYCFILEKRLSKEVFDEFLSLKNVHVVADADCDEARLFEEARRLVRDAKDRPVFALAKRLFEAKAVDLFISGDKDLLTPNVRKALAGKLLSPAEFRLR